MQNSTAKADLRRAVVAVTISSFSIAALMGIGALLGAGDFGTAEVRILLTTVVVGSGSVLTLCCLVVVGKRFETVGLLGFLVTLATTLLGLVLVWSGSEDLVDNLLETFGVAGVASASLAQVCLLLGLAGTRRALAALLWATVALAGVLAALVSAVIYEYQPGDGFWRFFGVVAILDVLGTLVTIALAVFGTDDDKALTITLPPALAVRLRSQASETGRPVRDLVDEALARYYGLPVD